MRRAALPASPSIDTLAEGESILEEQSGEMVVFRYDVERRP